MAVSEGEDKRTARIALGRNSLVIPKAKWPLGCDALLSLVKSEAHFRERARTTEGGQEVIPR